MTYTEKEVNKRVKAFVKSLSTEDGQNELLETLRDADRIHRKIDATRIVPLKLLHEPMTV